MYQIIPDDRRVGRNAMHEPSEQIVSVLSVSTNGDSTHIVATLDRDHCLEPSNIVSGNAKDFSFD